MFAYLLKVPSPDLYLKILGQAGIFYIFE